MAQSDRAPANGRLYPAAFLSTPLDEYLPMVGLTGRAIRGDKPGAIPEELGAILERL